VSDDLSRVTERVRQNRTQRQTDADARGSQQPTPATRAPGIFIGRDRVFDTVTGQAGNVEGGPGLVTGPSAIVPVRLDDGTLVVRPARELVQRPLPPTVGSM